MPCQVASDVRARFWPVSSLALRIDDQDLDSFGLHKQWQSVRDGADGFTRCVPRHDGAAHSRNRSMRRNQKDWPGGTEYEGLRKAWRSCGVARRLWARDRSEEHTSELQTHSDLVCRLLLEKKNN